MRDSLGGFFLDQSEAAVGTAKIKVQFVVFLVKSQRPVGMRDRVGEFGLANRIPRLFRPVFAAKRMRENAESTRRAAEAPSETTPWPTLNEPPANPALDLRGCQR